MISDLGVKGGVFFFFFPFCSFPSLPALLPELSALLALDNAPFYCPAFAFLLLGSLQLRWVLGRRERDISSSEAVLCASVSLTLMP